MTRFVCGRSEFTRGALCADPDPTASRPAPMGDRPTFLACTGRRTTSGSSLRELNRAQGNSDVLQRNGTRTVTQIPQSSKIKDSFQDGIGIREKTILQHARCDIGGMAGDWEGVDRHRSESCTDIGGDPAVPLINASDHPTAAMDTNRYLLDLFRVWGFGICVFGGPLISVSCVHGSLLTASAIGTNEILAMLASKRFVKLHLNSPD